jgi:hypothetical protein
MNNEAQTQHFISRKVIVNIPPSLMTNTEAQTILQKIKELGFVEGKTLTEIADKLGTNRATIWSIKTKIEAHKDCINGNFKSHYKKINLKKYKDYYVFSEPRLYVICYKESDKFKQLMGI